MTELRLLIVVADDFGQSAGVNRGVVHAHRNGIVTGTSLMVRHEAAGEAVEMSRTCPYLSLGLHLDFGEWRLSDGEWVPVYEMPLGEPEAVRREVDRQLAAFRRLVGRNPTHIDSHQHVHLRGPVRSIVETCAHELSVPVRRCDPRIGYCGDFYGRDANGSPIPGRISVEGLVGILEALPPGVTELCCHPATGGDLETMYSAERAQELEVLCDPRIREAIERLGIKLCSFEEIRP